MNIGIVSSFGEVLKAFRKKKGMSQQVVANRLDVHFNTISKWERGICLPDSKGIVLELARQLRLNEQETRQLLEASLTAISPHWNIPYQRNPFFTGREAFLQTLHHRFRSERSIVLSQSYTLSGLGGIGKTQLALEYVYQHALDYSAIFWIAAETSETLYAGFAMIATQLQLVEREEKEAEKVVHAVLRWLNTHNEWLLIFDNVVSIALLKPFLPTARQGAILVTTQLRTMEDLSYTLELPPFSSDEGVLFLLHRARLIDSISSSNPLPSELVEAAQALVKAVGGLPLALDQAGAYIERTGCSVIDYLHLFQHHQISLLAERSEIAHHSTSVVKTFLISFEQMMQRHEVAADLLRLCAFLAPDTIPEELLTKGVNFLGAQLKAIITEPYRFNQMLEEALRYSLLSRQPQNSTLSIHRLVQAVLQDTLSKAERRIWAERAMLAVNAAFPDVEYNTWPQCERLLPHVQVCITWIEQESIFTVEAPLLLYKAGIYLRKRGQYSEAELLLVRALAICERHLGTEHSEMARCLDNLAILYRLQGKYEQAELLFQRALTIYEQSLGAEHPDTARCLNNLATLYGQQGKYGQAEPLFQRVLSIREQQLGTKHPETARCLNSLAILYQMQGKYEQAELLFQRTLAIYEQSLGAEHPDTSMPLHGLADLYQMQGKYEQAEPLFQRALSNCEQHLGMEHPNTAYPLCGLADLYLHQGKYEQAEPLFQRALSICEQQLGAEHPDTASSLHGLAYLYLHQGKYEQAEPLFQRTLSIREQQLGAEHPNTAESLCGLADLYQHQRKYEQAESLYQQAIRIHEQVRGPNSLAMTFPLNGLANLYRAKGKYEEAEALYQRTLCIREWKLGQQHPYMGKTLYDLGVLQEMQGKTQEAMSLYQRALTIREKAFGCKHPKTSEVSERLQTLLL